MLTRIRAARLVDAEGMVAVLNPIIAAGCYTVLDGPLTVAAQRQFISEFPERGVLHVAERTEDGQIVGLQDVAPLSADSRAFEHVGTIATFVDLAHRRQGIGKQLFAATFAAAQEQGFEKLFTQIRADNPAALAAYQHHGFYVVGTARRHARVNGRLVDEVIVERFL